VQDTLFFQIGIGVALGLLVGLQRERADSGLAGIRTFPLITLLGVFTGALAPDVGGWLISAGFLSLAALLVMGNALRLREEGTDAGMTTEVAALVMFGVGVLLTREWLGEAIVAAGGVAVLLHWKAPLHRFVDALGKDDVAALMRLVLIALVVLPVLPNRTYGPYEVLNPFEIWLMVVLIVGISMAGYVAFKLFGTKAGAIAAGVLGGMISSTATTVSYARRSADDPSRSPAAALVVALASSVVFVRVLVEVAVVAPGVLTATVGPLVAMMVVMLVVSGGLYWAGIGGAEAETEDRDPPSDLGSALAFGALYALVLLGVAFAEDRLGQGGLYAVAGISGLTDLDAITLSTANLMQAGELETSTGWRMILTGALSNLVFKGAVVMALGSAALRRRIAVAFAAAMAGGVAILLLWPG